MILIENEIVFVSTPKCASISIHSALEKTNLKIEPTFIVPTNNEIIGGLKFPDFINNNDYFSKIKIHGHISISEIYTFLNQKVNTIVIKRDFFKRFISCFHYLFGWWIPTAYGIYYTPNVITNEFIYKHFTDEVIDIILQLPYSKHRIVEFHKKLKNLLIKPLIENYSSNYNKSILLNNLVTDDMYTNFTVILSQEHWKSGYKPTYEFDINELYKLEDMLFDKYNKEIKIGKENSMNKALSNINIIEDQKLRDWVWNKFEKQHFTKKIF